VNGVPTALISTFTKFGMNEGRPRIGVLKWDIDIGFLSSKCIFLPLSEWRVRRYYVKIGTMENFCVRKSRKCDVLFLFLAGEH